MDLPPPQVVETTFTTALVVVELVVLGEAQMRVYLLATRRAVVAVREDILEMVVMVEALLVKYM
jgi:hypothetical protein